MTLPTHTMVLEETSLFFLQKIKNKTDNNKKSNDMFLLYGLEIVGMHSNIELFNQNCFFSGP